MVFKIKTNIIQRFVTSSRSHRITFEFFIYILFKIVNNKLLQLFHYIGEILAILSIQRHRLKTNIIDHVTKYLPKAILINHYPNLLVLIQAVMTINRTECI